MEDLDYKDLFRDAIRTIAYIARAAGFDPNDPTVEPPAIVARVENQRAALERLTAALEEARLTLAAEQGRAEGAPSEGWEWDSHAREWWRNTPVGRITVSALGGRADLYGWSVDYPGQRHAIHRPTARAAMLAADAAVVVAKIERLDRKQGGRTT